MGVEGVSKLFHIRILFQYKKTQPAGSKTPPLYLSVRKVVPTLTITSAEIYLLMAGAKQHNDTGFILVPVVGRTSSRVALEALYCVAPWCLQRGLQA
jgi:hypothetical protein